MKRPKAQDIIKALKAKANPGKGAFLERYFKTGKSGYAEGDVFFGLTVPESRLIAKQFFDIDFPEIIKLLRSKIHEVRSVGLIILTIRFAKANNKEQEKIFRFYLAHTDCINNWDLVDLSASKIVGEYLLNTNRKILYKLAKSKDLWERRIAIIATYAFIRKGEFADTLAIAETLISDKHDLIHKAIGWMLREVGKKDERALCDFLDKHCLDLPRITLRYAIEKFPEKRRLGYLRFKG
jgi:3-methyladenine DNA glycosylase AlkD